MKWKILTLIFLPMMIFLLATVFFSEEFLKETNGPLSTYGDLAPMSSDVSERLTQPFTYLNEGGQAYAFVSEDGKSVLKLFKSHRLTPHWLIKALPDWGPFSKYKQQHIAKRKRKLSTALLGHQIAFQELPYESRLFYVQMRHSKKEQIVTLIDQKGVARNVDLSKLLFVLQEKGEILSTVFSRHLDRGETEAVRQHIENVCKLYISEYKKGIIDIDHGVMHNIGIAEGFPFHLDVGKLTKDDTIKNPDNYQKDLNKIIGKIQEWVKKNYPEYANEVSEKV